jgi:uncharacterized protein (TIGR02996 family)
MAEEHALLATLKASPTDDLARLAYADWLDEHDEPAKAEYLRLVVALATRESKGFTGEQPDVARILSLAPTIPGQWRANAGSRFCTVFKGCPNGPRGRRDGNVVRSMQRFSGLSYPDVDKLYDQPPSTFLGYVLFEQAIAARDEILAVPGAQVEVRPSDPLTGPTLYNVIAQTCGWMMVPCTDTAREIRRASRGPFTVFLNAVLGITLDDAWKLARQDQAVTLADQVELAYALVRVAELRLLVPRHNGRENWSISIQHQPAGKRSS